MNDSKFDEFLEPIEGPRDFLMGLINIDLDNNRVYSDRARIYMRLLDISTNGGHQLDFVTQIHIAQDIAFFNNSELAIRYKCSIENVKRSINKYIAALAFAMKEDLQLPALSTGQSYFFNLLSSAIESRSLNTMLANEFANVAIFHPWVKDYFSYYAQNLETNSLFATHKKRLSREQYSYVDAGTRAFLNPNSKVLSGFPEILQRYLFSRLKNSWEDYKSMSVLIEMSQEAKLEWTHSRFRDLNHLRNFGKSKQIRKHMDLLIDTITNEGKASELGSNYVILSKFVYNNLLLQSKKEFNTEFYIKNIVQIPAQQLKQIRQSVVERY